MSRKKKIRRGHAPPRKKTRHPKSSFDMGAELNQARELHSLGRLSEAEGVYRKILVRHPDHPDTLHLLGIIAIQVGQNKVAADLIRKALLGAPKNPVYQSNLGNALKALGQRDNAVACYRKATRIKPDFADAHYNMATVFQDQGKLSDAVRSYKKTLKIKPDYANAHNNLGIILQAQGNFSEAIERYRASLNLAPGNAEAFNNLGTALQQQGDFAQAMNSFESALKILPDFVDALYNMGNAQYELGDLNGAISSFQRVIDIRPDHADAYYNMGTVHQERDELSLAATCFQKTIALQPQHFKAHNNLGNTLFDLGRSAEALSCFEEAIKIKSDFVSAHNNRGNALKEMGEIEEALSAYRKACEIDPEYANSYVNIGMILKDIGQTDTAISNFEKALALQPEMPVALSHLTHQFQHVCDFEKFPALSRRLDAVTRQVLESDSRPVETPFVNISRHANPSLNYSVARSWSRQIARQTANLKPSFSFGSVEANPGKITVGYLSNNFRDHPMAHIMAGLFRRHDRSAFNIFCYSSGHDDGSIYRKQIQADCDRFVDLQGMTTLDAARRIHQDRVDILVDLMGHTQNDMMAVASLRPAPIQSRYLGMAGSTGADFFDYIIADRIIIPEEDMRFYSEKPVWLPDCYQVNDRDQITSDKEYHRSDFGLPEDGVVFCSFNTSYKIDPLIFDAWMRILMRISDSVLWLLSKNRTMEENLKKAARASGVSPDRLLFAGKLPKAQHLARIGLADLVLDTRIVGGAASTSDALWAGTPVITMTGTHFASRMSTSILKAINLPDMITKNMAEYEALAVDLARNPGKLEAVKHRLAENRNTAPLFDTPRFTRNLEKAYREMWEIYARGDSPRPITVTPFQNAGGDS